MYHCRLKALALVLFCSYPVPPTLNKILLTYFFTYLYMTPLLCGVSIIPIYETPTLWCQYYTDIWRPYFVVSVLYRYMTPLLCGVSIIPIDDAPTLWCQYYTDIWPPPYTVWCQYYTDIWPPPPPYTVWCLYYTDMWYVHTHPHVGMTLFLHSRAQTSARPLITQQLLKCRRKHEKFLSVPLRSLLNELRPAPAGRAGRIGRIPPRNQNSIR